MMPDTNSFTDRLNQYRLNPPALTLQDLQGLMKLLGGRALDLGLQVMTAPPDVYNFAARGPKYLASQYLPPAVSGALRDARQYVETAPGIRRQIILANMSASPSSASRLGTNVEIHHGVAATQSNRGMWPALK